MLKLNSQKLIPIDDRFDLPKRFSDFREPQIVLAEQVAALFEAGADVVCLEATVGFGKAQPLSEPVLTIDGFLPMGEIKVGSIVFDEASQPTQVKAIWPQGLKEVYRVSFQDGSSTLCCGDHLWKVRQSCRNDKLDKKWFDISTADLMKRRLTRLSGFGYYRIPVAPPVEFGEANLPIDPYLLGLLLGDGGMKYSSISLTSIDEEILSYARVEANKMNLRLKQAVSNRITYEIVGEHGQKNPLIQALRNLGLKGRSSGDKFVPPIYKFASVSQRLELLRGLMDTDGFQSKCGKANEFSSKSETLARDVVEIAQSLGGIAKITSRVIKGTIYWRVNLKIMQCPFKLERKASRWICPTKYPPARIIVSIEPEGEMECQCISVESNLQTYLTKDYIVTHNSLFAEMVRQLLHCKMVFAAPRIDLQKQFQEAIDYSKLLQGRSNFPHGGRNGISDYPKITCADCRENSFCKGSCAYKEAKMTFISADVGVTNTSYYLAAANYLGMFRPHESEHPSDEERETGKGNRRPAWRGDFLTCFDEADTMGLTLLKFMGVNLEIKYVQDVIEYVGLQWDLKAPKPPVGKFDGWWQWLQETIEVLTECARKYGEPDNNDVREVRWYTKLQKTILSLGMVREDWVYDPERAKGKAGRKTGDALEVRLKPMLIKDQGNEILWRHCGKVLAMSGSFVNINVWKEETGLDCTDKKVEFIRYDSDWPKHNALIHRVPGVKMVKEGENKKLPWKEQPFWDTAVGNIANILMRYPNERTMIYAHSYDLSSDLGDALIEIFDDQRIIVDRGEKIRIEEDDTPEEREEKLMKAGKLNEYLSRPGSVIISPKFGRGTDLYGPRCRNIILAKTPFPFLGDRRTQQLKETTKNGQLWYMINTVRECIQIFGRGRRFYDDWVRIWVVDDAFDMVCSMRGLLPPSFLACIRPKKDYMSRFKPLEFMED